MNKVTDIMFSLLSFEVFGNEVSNEIKSEITPEILPDLYKLSKKHELAHLISDALAKNEIEFEDNEYFKRFQFEQLGAFCMDETQAYECGRICTLFEENGIDFVPLKGSVTRNYYPEQWMRTRCDIDILVKRESIEKASELLTGKLGYRYGATSTHDVAFATPSKILLELHFDLNESDFRVIDKLSTPWENTHKAESKNFEHALNEDYFVFYHIVHMAKHFSIGGCGVKPFLDLCLFDKVLGYDKAAVADLCKGCGLDKFYSQILELQKVWFEGAPHSEMTLLLHEYVLTGGVYGNYSNRIAVARTKVGGKKKFVLSRIFLSLDSLRKNYRNENITYFTYPYYMVKRWFNLLKKEKRIDVAKELSTLDAITDEKTTNVDIMLKGLGL